MAKVDFSNNHYERGVTEAERRVADKVERKLTKALNDSGREKLKHATGRSSFELGEQPRLFSDGLSTSVSLDAPDKSGVVIQTSSSRVHPTQVQLLRFEDFDSKRLAHAERYISRKTSGSAFAAGVQFFFMAPALTAGILINATFSRPNNSSPHNE